MTLTPVVEQLKDPNAVLDYGFDWTDWLSGDTISTSTWVVEPGPTGPPTMVSPSNTDTSASVWLSGGTVGLDYLLRNRIVTVGVRTEDRTMLIRIRER